MRFSLLCSIVLALGFIVRADAPKPQTVISPLIALTKIVEPHDYIFHGVNEIECMRLDGETGILLVRIGCPLADTQITGVMVIPLGMDFEKEKK